MGHGVHQLNAWLLCQAVEQCEDPTVDPASAECYGTFTVQKTYLHLYPENSITVDVQTPLSCFGGKTAYEKAVDAFAHHKSQQQWFSVEHAGRYDFRKFGLYRSTVGENTGNDPFEHVTFSDTMVPTESISSEETPPPEEASGSIPEEPDTGFRENSTGMGNGLPLDGVRSARIGCAACGNIDLPDW